MVAISNEALEWLDRAEQAREVAGQLTDPGASRAVLQVADTFDRLARAAIARAAVRKRKLPTFPPGSRASCRCGDKIMVDFGLQSCRLLLVARRTGNRRGRRLSSRIGSRPS